MHNAGGESEIIFLGQDEKSKIPVRDHVPVSTGVHINHKGIVLLYDNKNKKRLQTMIFLKEKLLLLLNFLEKSVQSMVDIFMVVTRRADTEKSILCFVTQYLMRKVFLITTLNSLKSAIRGAKIDPHHVPLVMLRRKIM